MPRMRRTACHPSDARRRSAAERLTSGNPATSLSVDAAVCLIGTTEDNTSGAQKIGCSRNDLCGSWAKAETPPPPEFGTCFGIVPSGYHCPVVALIVLIAAKKFPGDVGNVSVL